MKRVFLFLAAALVLVSSVAAEDVFREPAYRSDSHLYLYNFPYWIGTSEVTAVYVTNVNAATAYATIRFNGSAANMSAVSSSLFRAYVTSASEEDVNFSVTYYDSGDVELGLLNDTLRFRTPFDVEFDFYKADAPGANTSSSAYNNEFQYAVLQLTPDGTPSSIVDANLGVNLANKIGSFIPFGLYTPVGGAAAQVRVTHDVFLYGKLSGNAATVKMYENGTYTLSTMQAKVFGGLTPFYEFGRPITNADLGFNVANAGAIPINNESDASYSVYISAWEVYKANLLFSFGKMIFVLLLWGVVSIGVSWGCVFWMPPDTRPKAFTVVAVIILLVMSPLLVAGIRLVW